MGTGAVPKSTGHTNTQVQGGYVLETPEEWIVVAGEVPVGEEVLKLADPSGRELRIERVAGQHSLLQLGQLRLDELGDGVHDLTVSVETTVVGETMRLIYLDVSTSRRVTEYMVVRASLREEGLGYILTFSRGPVVGNDEHTTVMSRIFESFTLLGAVDGG